MFFAPLTACLFHCSVIFAASIRETERQKKRPFSTASQTDDYVTSTTRHPRLPSCYPRRKPGIPERINAFLLHEIPAFAGITVSSRTGTISARYTVSVLLRCLYLRRFILTAKTTQPDHVHMLLILKHFTHQLIGGAFFRTDIFRCSNHQLHFQPLTQFE